MALCPSKKQNIPVHSPRALWHTVWELQPSGLLFFFFPVVKIIRDSEINHDFLKLKSQIIGQAWWFTTVSPEFRRLRQEDCEFEANLGYSP
jgi:hypothetical protein